MNQDEARAMLAAVSQAETRLADRAHWPFRRHAAFGLAEGLLIAAIAQPVALFLPFFVTAITLIAWCAAADRRSHGFFVSGWQRGPARIVTVAITAFVIGMAVAASLVRDGSAQPMGYLLGAITFIVCTAGSILWERVYGAHLARGTAR